MQPITKTALGKLILITGLLTLCSPFSISAQAPEPAKIFIVFHSHAGHTKAMAQAVAQGARSITGTQVRIAPVSEAEVKDLLWADAVILGCPVYNANVTPEMQTFINQWPFEGRPLDGKLGAAFTSAGGISSGEEAVQLSLLRSMLIFGMVVTGGDDWTTAFGAAAVTDEEPFLLTDSTLGEKEQDEQVHVDARFLEKARRLGQRVARLAQTRKPALAKAGPAPVGPD